MKELTIEEKAKAYDEALKVLHKYDGANIMFTQDLKEEMFPELAESEDERIRKSLIDMLKNDEKCYLKEIAWLEKQGEHANFRNKIQIGDKVTRNKDGVLVNLSQLKRVAKKEEKQGEQKTTEISNVCEFSIETWIKIVDYVLTEHNGIGNYLINPEVKDTAEKLQKKYKFDAASEEWDRVYRKGLDAGVNKGRAEAIREQKPTEWSEEDEKQARQIERIVHNDGCTQKLQKQIADWLKNLRGRVQPQPQQEWNEEDENRLSDAVFFVREYQIPTRDKRLLNVAKEAEEWLKSLSPQNRWKPSDGQMTALNYVVNLMASSESPVDNDYYYNVFKDLREQLKKLKE